MDERFSVFFEENEIEIFKCSKMPETETINSYLYPIVPLFFMSCYQDLLPFLNHLIGIPFRSGTFQQYIAVKPYDAVKLPDHTDLSIIAPILCAVRRSIILKSPFSN